GRHRGRGAAKQPGTAHAPSPAHLRLLRSFDGLRLAIALRIQFLGVGDVSFRIGIELLLAGIAAKIERMVAIAGERGRILRVDVHAANGVYDHGGRSPFLAGLPPALALKARLGSAGSCSRLWPRTQRPRAA